MNRNLAICSLCLLTVVAACGGGPGSGADTPATAAGPVTAVAPATTAASTTIAPTIVPTIPPSTLPSVSSIVPPIPTAAPSPYYFPGCRNVDSLYDPTGLRRDYDVQLGDCGVGVLEVQQYLNYSLGYRVAEDGQFGARSEAAVREYQTLYSLPVTGVVDHDTYQSLLSDECCDY